MQDYQDAMSIVSKYGKPDLFVTFTCNPKWRETKENLKPGQAASGRPDLIAREFRLKQEEMFEDLFRRHVLGEMAAWIAVYEWQRRGLLRVHILSTDRQTEDGGRGGQAQVYEIATKNVVHRKYGMAYPNAPCMRDGACSKQLPMDLREMTELTPDRYPKYRRREKEAMLGAAYGHTALMVRTK
ncbi:hypothetical protein ANCDUO_04338 [Ancylostoma duodenale]|uniref:Helitron helicase-like domain-containing protein n=1 Tax=Ancylostoma duodenale TaxID=51022 RepID=A0A0C2DRH7_9BILA|nr:hypothetical protein ANCDUO_04338 [Ancylostoma duodenale]